MLPPDGRGRELGLDDTFSAGPEWHEDRFDIADQSQSAVWVPNLAAATHLAVLELRLAKQLDSFYMNVATRANIDTNRSPKCSRLMPVFQKAPKG